MRVLDLFAGLGGWSAAARDRGHDVRTLDLDPRFGTTYVADILDVTPETFGDWRPDLVLASPPCETFTTLRIGVNWTAAGEPRRPEAERGVRIVGATLDLSDRPRHWHRHPAGHWVRFDEAVTSPPWSEAEPPTSVEAPTLGL